jgi:hypothetical protein
VIPVIASASEAIHLAEERFSAARWIASSQELLAMTMWRDRKPVREKVETARRANRFTNFALGHSRRAVELAKSRARKIEFHQSLQADLGRPDRGEKIFRFTTALN